MEEEKSTILLYCWTFQFISVSLFSLSMSYPRSMYSSVRLLVASVAIAKKPRVRFCSVCFAADRQGDHYRESQSVISGQLNILRGERRRKRTDVSPLARRARCS